MIVIDASRPDYSAFARLPHIGALMKHGIVYERATVGELESSTPDVHVTFGTGTFPRENGFDGFGWAAPGSRQAIDFRTLLANGGIDPVLRSLPIPSVAARLHQYMPQSVSIAASGHKDYAVVGLGGAAATYELFGKFDKGRFNPSFMHAPPPLSAKQRAQLTWKAPLKMGREDSWAFTYAAAVAAKVKPRLLMMNVPETDTWGHWYGPQNAKVFNLISKNVDHGVGEIENTYRRLGILNHTDFIITADHAMMESHPAHNWHTIIGLAAGIHTRVVRGDTEGGSIWLQDPTRAQAMAERIVQARPQHVDAVFYRSAPGDSYQYLQASPTSWLTGQDAATALRTLVNTTAGRNGPDVWVLYRENYTVVPRNVSGQWKGTHGGPTWKVQHIPLIISGPDIRPGIHSLFPARAIDIAPTLERLLGLPSIKRDGVALADAFADASRAETNAERAVFPQRTTDVLAMKRQSAADDAPSPRWPSPPASLARCSFPPASSLPPRHPCVITAKVATNQ